VPPALLGPLTRFGARFGTTNLVVTNVPGSQAPVYMLGARMLATYPVVPLGPKQGLGIALTSYDGGLYWGFNSDWDAFPDLHDFAEEIHAQFEALLEAAGSSGAGLSETG